MLKNLKAFLALLAPYRAKVAIAAVIGAIAGLGTGGGFASGAEQLFGQVFSNERNLPTGQVMMIAMIFPALFLMVGLSTFGSAYLLNHAGLSAIRSLRSRLFAHLQSLPLSYFQTQKTGDLISRLTADTQLLQHTLALAARDVIVQPVTLISAIGYLIYTAVTSQGVVYIYLCIAVLPLVVFPIRHFSRRLQTKATSQQQELASLTNDIAQNLGAAREVRAFNLQERETTTFNKRVAELFRSQMKVIKYSFALSPVIELISSFGLAVAFVLGYRSGVEGGVFVGIFVALYFSYSPLKRIGKFAGELHIGAAALQRVQAILDTPPDIKDPSNPVAMGRATGEIEFRDVSLQYGDTTALFQINARIGPGEICALVGPSGAGKSSFANLVPRFFEASSGSVSIDGHNVKDLLQSELREQIALVSQEPVLFDDTILENIRLGRQGATDEEVMQAAADAYADDFIREQPEGYLTMVGERGTRLSGGQKQRLAIARAFLRQAPILILDEATSALDSESERMVQLAIAKLVAGKTVLIIAHRFSSIKNAGQILVFDNGRIVDSGNHEALYARCPLYRQLYNQQNGR